MKALLVIDMQEDYVGEGRNKKRFPYDAAALLGVANAAIARAQANGAAVIYVKNKFKMQGAASQLVSGLQIVSDAVYEKQAASCFSNPALVEHLRANGVDEVELVGVDGNFCVGKSALHGKKLGLAVYLLLSAVGTANQSRFETTRQALLNAGVELQDA